MIQINEIEIQGFDDDNIPVIRVFDNDQSYLIFEEFPPENDRLPEKQMANLERVLSKISGVDVMQDDRGLFIINSNKDEIIDKIICFFKNTTAE